MNYSGGLLKAKNQFFKDLQNDVDFIEYKNYESVTYEDGIYNVIISPLKHILNREIKTNFGVVSVANDQYCTDKKINSIVKKYLK